MNPILLQIEHLKKTFDGVTLVKNVSFSVHEQSIVLITGGNGAGKTTLFNLMTGLEKATAGNIVFKGNNIIGCTPLQIARLGITRLYQQPRLFKNLSVWENLVSSAHHTKENSVFTLIFQPKKAKLNDEQLKKKSIELLNDFGLQAFKNTTVGELSYGQQKIISFCMVAMNETQLALLDEPFAGLNPQTINKLSEVILKMQAKGCAFLIIEHNLDKALAICDKHIEMNEGQIKIMNLKQQSDE